MNEAQIKHMVERFLQWKLPEDFHPDAGVKFTPHEKAAVEPERFGPGSVWWPVGTNLLTFVQAREMVRFMLEGLPEQ